MRMHRYLLICFLSFSVQRRRRRSRIFPCKEKRRLFGRREAAGNPDASVRHTCGATLFRELPLRVRLRERVREASFPGRRRGSFLQHGGGGMRQNGKIFKRSSMARRCFLQAYIQGCCHRGGEGDFPAGVSPAEGARERAAQKRSCRAGSTRHSADDGSV